MSFDRPGGPGDRGSDDLPPFPGAPEDRPHIPPPNVRTWDEILADRPKYKTQSEFEAAIRAELGHPGRPAAENKSPAEEFPSEADAKPDDSPDETAALRKRIADLEADKARLAAENRELRAENAGIRTEISDLKAANTERDWRDRARDDKIADQAKDIEDLKETVTRFLKERTDEQPDGGEPASAIERHDHDETNEAADRARPTRRWHLPSNTKISLLSSIVGEAAAADHVPTHTSDYVGIGVATVSLGASAVAAWREHRENRNDDTDDRPHG